jgi:Ca-activated chloride channel family protein
LFYGQELAVFGRYKNSGLTSITLLGSIAGEKKTFHFEKTFPESESKNEFLEKLWATRKVAWLLDQVRMAGESDELRKEIEELARKYSIVTPYTSYLAVEDKPVVAGGSPPPPPRRYPPVHPLESRDKLAMASSAPAQADAEPRGQFQKSADSGMLRAESGAAAVNAAETLRAMKSAETVVPSGGQTRQVRGKTFQLQGDVWKDQAIPDKLGISVKIKYLSEAWFQLSENFDELRDFLALGEQVQVQMENGSTLVIAKEGIESIDDNTLVTLGIASDHKK